ncbi:MAG: hypothetical protein J5669_05275 [Bacteroidales bacterium]|nr:hypothetical protein [Bacteroidales bacterium]
MTKRAILAVAALLISLSLSARDFRLQIARDIPARAAQVLEQRFTSMLSAAGHHVTENGAPIQISASVADRMETPGTMSQVALTIELKAQAGEAEEVFTLTGVGSDDADAWLRAVKQLLPKSKATKAFTDKL